MAEHRMIAGFGLHTVLIRATSAETIPSERVRNCLVRSAPAIVIQIRNLPPRVIHFLWGGCRGISSHQLLRWIGNGHSTPNWRLRMYRA